MFFIEFNHTFLLIYLIHAFVNTFLFPSILQFAVRQSTMVMVEPKLVTWLLVAVTATAYNHSATTHVSHWWLISYK